MPSNRGPWPVHNDGDTTGQARAASSLTGCTNRSDYYAAVPSEEGGITVRLSQATYGILSSTPPTPCGIATFSVALGTALRRRGATVNMVRVLDRPEAHSTSVFPVLAELIATDPSTATGAIEALNRCDAAIVQHEYGLYGGTDGSDILRVLDGVHVPKLVVLHTALPNPTPHQRDILNAVIAQADQIVVMTRAAASVLESVNDIGPTPVEVIPHGAAVTSGVANRQIDTPPLLLTWGLIGPGKGIEWVIDAMAGLRDLTPTPQYLVMGRTHPKVLAHEGDVYRHMLEQRVRANGVGDLVRFDNAYYDLDYLTAVITSADAVILPYDSFDQATSGVLVDAIAAGRPVIATSFPHSRELLGTGAGIIVNHRDPASIGDAIRRVVTEPALATSMAREARSLAPGLSWDAVAEQYVRAARPFLQRANADA